MSRPPPRTLRVLSYNIHGGIGHRGILDPAAILAVVRAADADLVALQEVDDDPSIEAGLLRALEGLGYPCVLHGPTFYKDAGGSYGNLLLSRLPLLRSELIDLSVPRREPRGAIHAHFTCGAARLEVLTTHLGLGLGERRWQVARLDQLLPDWRTVSAETVRVGLGDFNEWILWGRTRRRLHHLFGHSPRPSTFPARWPFLALDRIFVRPRAALRHLAPIRTEAARRASDHLPLLAEVAVKHGGEVG